MLNSPHKIYQQSSVQTANGNQLVIMLYEGAIRFTRSGIEGIRLRNLEMANMNLVKAQAVVNELYASLNQEYPISKQLTPIYEYMLYQLIQANIKKDEAPALEVLEHLTELLGAWKQIIKGPVGQSMKEVGSIG